jgi:GTP-binding protein
MAPFRIKTVEFIKSAYGQSDLIRDGLPQVAFAGRSNVGKSSLLNVLLGRKNLARTSSTPGRTREINYFLVNESLYFVDLPGYGYAKVSRSISASWRPMIEGYLNDNAALRLVLVLLDVRRIPNQGDLELLEWLEAAGAPYLPVLTKRDKLSKTAFGKQERKIRQTLGIDDPDSVAIFSARTREGRDALLATIGEAVNSRIRT